MLSYHSLTCGYLPESGAFVNPEKRVTSACDGVNPLSMKDLDSRYLFIDLSPVSVLISPPSTLRTTMIDVDSLESLRDS